MRGAVGTAALAASVLLAAPASAQDASAPLRVEGGITVTWRGAPERGCAAAGLCGVTGSLSWRPGSEGELELHGDSAVSGYIFGEPAAVVRVRRHDATGEPGLCTDIVSTGFFPPILELEPAGRRELRATLAVEQAGLLSSGRCAGPTRADLADIAPNARVAARRLARGGLTLDLSGRRPFAAGALTGVVVSSVKIRVGTPQRDEGTITGGASIPASPPDRERPARYEVLEIEYRVTGMTGGLTTDFRGRPAPACRLLDACGVAGITTFAGQVKSGRLSLLARHPIHRSRGGVEDALRALRRGRTSLFAAGELEGTATVAAAVTRPGSPACNDSSAGALPLFGVTEQRDGLAVSLELQGISTVPEAVRTRCPGPSGDDVFDGTVASGTVPTATLGDPTLRVALRPLAATFTADAYAGGVRGELVLELRRTRARMLGDGGRR